MVIIAVACQKGGTGKTTTARTIAAGFADQDLQTLLIDLDEQATATYLSDMGEPRKNVCDLFEGSASVLDCITPTPRKNLFGIPAAYELNNADVKFKRVKQEYILRDALKPIKDRFDVCVIDCPPSIGLLTRNALVAANYVIIPVRTEVASIIAFRQLRANIDAVKAGYNPGLEVAGVIATQYNGRTKTNSELLKRIQMEAEAKGTRVFAPIREAAAMKQADIEAADVFAVAPRAAVCQDWRKLTKELLQIIKGEK